MNLTSIELFLSKLKHLHKSYGIKGLKVQSYEYTDYDNEISLLHCCIDKTDIENEKLKTTFKTLFEKEYFELLHPTLNIPTRAVFSCDNELCGFKDYNKILFFIDENNEHPWLLVQENVFAYILITQDEFLGLKYLNEPLTEHYKWILWLCLSNLPKIVQNITAKDLVYQDRKFALSFANPRPYHYFMDDLLWYERLYLQNALVLDEPMFLKHPAMKCIQDTSRLKIRPALFISRSNDFLETQITSFQQTGFKTLLNTEWGGGFRNV
ncbi:hypothetical protein OQH60_05725 [Campylobacter sp. MIT 21-1685]|uniref:hypothetical protein n=1 Tax=unclassified Campylobacter TaxID=2593542 RepID=UPI00224B3D07|nr:MULTISPECIES: hypothetical protein [unclassified Campylobacter]MCX2683299.1 hypothetical protein [Campylobacter sp. MIT 21-1684]MCX2751644.1 hypothetical protein [Campylobacter sp. MIT 21-1682]MCX2807845.1 hypothetical protein [Campylobacter sp. MIT 21-1685]